MAYTKGSKPLLYWQRQAVSLPAQRLYAASRALSGLLPFIYANRAHCEDLSVLRQAPLIARSWTRVASEHSVWTAAQLADCKHSPTCASCATNLLPIDNVHRFGQ